jgi:hypothetical protein
MRTTEIKSVGIRGCHWFLQRGLLKLTAAGYLGPFSINPEGVLHAFDLSHRILIYNKVCSKCGRGRTYTEHSCSTVPRSLETTQDIRSLLGSLYLKMLVYLKNWFLKKEIPASLQLW